MGFPFKVEDVQIECAHCQHQLEGVASFGLDIVRCGNCRKFTQIQTRATSTKVRTPVREEE